MAGPFSDLRNERMQDFIDNHSIEAEKEEEEKEGPPTKRAQKVDRDTTHAEDTEYNNWAMMCELNAREEYVWSNIMKLAIHQIELLEQSGDGGTPVDIADGAGADAIAIDSSASGGPSASGLGG